MLLLMLMVFTPALLVEATSVKMDFLSAGLVRTDPLMYSQIGECLSDHVHRLYIGNGWSQVISNCHRPR